MKATLGVWIDHRKAVIVAVTDRGEDVKEILSHVEKQPGRVKGVRSTTPYEARLAQADDSRERGLSGHLDAYYDEVITQLRNAKGILIFGPGEAKGELIKRMEKGDLGGRISKKSRLCLKKYTLSIKRDELLEVARRHERSFRGPAKGEYP